MVAVLKHQGAGAGAGAGAGSGADTVSQKQVSNLGKDPQFGI